MAMDSEKSTSHSWASGTTFPQHAQTRCGASAASAATITSAIAPPEQHRSARERPKKDSQMLRRTQKRMTSNPQKKRDMPRTIRVHFFSAAYISLPFRSYCSITRTIETAAARAQSAYKTRDCSQIPWRELCLQGMCKVRVHEAGCKLAFQTLL